MTDKKTVFVIQHESVARARVGARQGPPGGLRSTLRLLAGAMATTLFAGTAAAQDAIPTGGESATSPIGFLLIGRRRSPRSTGSRTTRCGPKRGPRHHRHRHRQHHERERRWWCCRVRDLDERDTARRHHPLGALVLGGFLGLPDGSGVQLVVALELLALYLVLRELGAYSFRKFVAVGAITTVLALSALGEPIIASLLNSQPGVILVLGVLYLGWRWLKQRRDSGGGGQTIDIETKDGGNR